MCDIVFTVAMYRFKVVCVDMLSRDNQCAEPSPCGSIRIFLCKRGSWQAQDNRTLTNFIETAVRQRVSAASSEKTAQASKINALPKTRSAAGQSR